MKTRSEFNILPGCSRNSFGTEERNNRGWGDGKKPWGKEARGSWVQIFYWELNPGPLGEQSWLLIAELFLHVVPPTPPPLITSTLENGYQVSKRLSYQTAMCGFSLVSFWDWSLTLLTRACVESGLSDPSSSVYWITGTGNWITIPNLGDFYREANQDDLISGGSLGWCVHCEYIWVCAWGGASDGIVIVVVYVRIRVRVWPSL